MEEPLHLRSTLGARVSVDKICRGYELEISRILLTVDLRVMDMLEFEVILRMDWLMAHRVVIDCDRKRVTTCTPSGICFMFQGDKHEQLMGWLARLTLEDEARHELGLPRTFCEYADIFSDELPGLPPHRDENFTIELHLGTLPISMTPHRMTPAKLQELKVQLQELLDRGFISVDPTQSTGGRYLLLIEKSELIF